MFYLIDGRLYTADTALETRELELIYYSYLSKAGVLALTGCMPLTIGFATAMHKMAPIWVPAACLIAAGLIFIGAIGVAVVGWRKRRTHFRRLIARGVLCPHQMDDAFRTLKHAYYRLGYGGYTEHFIEVLNAPNNTGLYKEFRESVADLLRPLASAADNGAVDTLHNKAEATAKILVHNHKYANA